MAHLNHCLPSYTPSPPAPDYTEDPAQGETSLGYSPRPGFRLRNPNCLFTKKIDDKVTLVLRGQEPDVENPWYGRDDLANGYLEFEEPERVTKITLLVRVEPALESVTVMLIIWSFR